MGILVYIEDLVMDSHKKVRVFVCEMLFDAMIWDVLTGLVQKRLPLRVMLRVKTLKSSIAENLIS